MNILIYFKLKERPSSSQASRHILQTYWRTLDDVHVALYTLTVSVSVLYYHQPINAVSVSSFTIIKCKIFKNENHSNTGWCGRQSRGLLCWLPPELLLGLSSLMGLEWKAQAEWLPHRPTFRHIQFQSEPAPISRASQHLNRRLSQLLDHCAPLEWSWFLINGIHTFVKRGSERKWLPKKEQGNLIETFSPHAQLSDTKLLLSEGNRRRTTRDLHVFS